MRPGWIDRLSRTVLVALVAGTLGACATPGGSKDLAAGSAAVAAAPSPEVEGRYASLLARHQAGEAAALNELASFSREHPDLAGPLYTLALARAGAGDEAGAASLLEQAAAVCSRCGPVWNRLGVLARQQGRFGDAEQAYQRAIQLEPGYAAAYFNLAVLYELYVPRPELALENYERYLEIGGPAADARDVEKWAADLRRRVNATPKAARADSRS